MKEFIINNYLVIIIIGAFLIFALIGFAVDSTKNKKNKESELLNKPNDEMDVDVIEELPEQKNETTVENEIVDTPEIPEANEINIDMDNN